MGTAIRSSEQAAFPYGGDVGLVYSLGAEENKENGPEDDEANGSQSGPFIVCPSSATGEVLCEGESQEGCNRQNSVAKIARRRFVSKLFHPLSGMPRNRMSAIGLNYTTF